MLLTSIFCSLIKDKDYREILASWILLLLHPIKKAFMYLTNFHSNHLFFEGVLQRNNMLDLFVVWFNESIYLCHWFLALITTVVAAARLLWSNWCNVIFMCSTTFSPWIEWVLAIFYKCMIYLLNTSHRDEVKASPMCRFSVPVVQAQALYVLDDYMLSNSFEC